MGRTKKRTVFTGILIAVATCLIASCNINTEATAPPLAVGQGTLIIDTEPNSIDAT